MSSKAFPINSCRSSADKVFAILRFLSDITVPLDLGSDFWLIKAITFTLIPQMRQQGKPKRLGILAFFGNKKAAPVSQGGFGDFSERSSGYFFFAARFSSIAACAAARRATGTRKGEQLT